MAALILNLGRPLFGSDLAVVYERLTRGYADILTNELGRRGISTRLVEAKGEVAAQVAQANSVLLLETAPKPEASLRATADRLLDLRRSTLVVTNEDLLGERYWSNLVPGVDPIRESAVGFSTATPATAVITRIEESIVYARTARLRRRVSLATIGLGVVSGLLAFALAVRATRVAKAAIAARDDAAAARQQAVEADEKAAQAARSRDEALRSAQLASAAKDEAERSAQGYAAQSAAIRDLLREKPTADFGKRKEPLLMPYKEHAQPVTGMRRYCVIPKVEALPNDLIPVGYTLFHAIGYQGTHQVQASSAPRPEMFDFYGNACYDDVRALFLSKDGKSIVRDRTSLCSHTAAVVNSCPTPAQ